MNTNTKTKTKTKTKTNTNTQNVLFHLSHCSITAKCAGQWVYPPKDSLSKLLLPYSLLIIKLQCQPSKPSYQKVVQVKLLDFWHW